MTRKDMSPEGKAKIGITENLVSKLNYNYFILLAN